MASKETSGFSSRLELEQIAKLLRNYSRLPFSPLNVPGAVMEGVLGHVRRAEVLNTYDFVDVVDREAKIGWQVKSTLQGTPVTWKRAKIRDRDLLIKASERSKAGRQRLGDAIIAYCNHHAKQSFEEYGLKQIFYSRLVVSLDSVRYFERLLCTSSSPMVFDPAQFRWEWSKPKEVIKKEQLTALNGIDMKTGKKWFAWHGRGENQLHFSGESAWWPQADAAENSIQFELPHEDKLSIEAFIDLLADKKCVLESVD